MSSLPNWRSIRSRIPAISLPSSPHIPTWLLLAIPLFGVGRIAYQIYRAALPPPGYPGIEDLEEAGTLVDEEKKKEEAMQDSVDYASQFGNAKKYDFIICGGGTTGCVIAARLSEDPSVSVLLLEAGHSDQLQIFSRIPATFGRMFLNKSADWGYWTNASPHVAGRKIRWPRARLLGGCSSINAMMCHHCSPSDFDELASITGADHLSHKALAPYFTKSQAHQASDAWPHDPHPSRGTSGPVKVGYSYLNQLSAAFVDTCDKVGILKRKDLNTDGDGTGRAGAEGTMGVSRTTTFIHGGSRVSSATSYLTPEVTARPNLHIAVGATVTRVLFSTADGDRRAVGVEFTNVDIAYDAKNKDGQSERPVYRAMAKKEVILTAGSIGTPHILMVSGVGPRRELSRHKIDCVVDLPGVGQNLLDHLAVGMGFETKPGTSSHFLVSPNKSLASLIEWLRYKSGPLTSNLGEALAFVRSTEERLSKTSGVDLPTVENVSSEGVGPDIELLFTPLLFAEHGTAPPHTSADGITIAALLLRPKSRGSISLTGPTIFDKPSIDAQLLAEENDVRVLVWSLKLIAKIAASDPLAKSVVGPAGTSPGHPPFPDVAKSTDEELGQWVRKYSETLYHPVGTVKIGSAVEKGGCLDNELRVYGVKGLRVCDASVWPEQLSGHPMAPLIALTEMLSDRIKEKYAVTK